MYEPLITHLEAFDRRGMHTGAAKWLPTGRWRVLVTAMSDFYYCDTEQEARNFLSAYGAATIQQSEGKK